METISDDWFGPDPLPLQKLYLQGNALQLIPDGVFKSLPHLTVLSLFNNKITTLGEHTFDGLENLQELYLSTNKIRTIAANTFAGLESLTLLGLDQNSLKTVSGEWFGTDPLPVRQLYLYRSSVQAIHDGAFRSLPDLTMLSLYGNQITTLNERTFDGLGNLQELFLWNNRVSSVAENTFARLRSLIMLGLDDNALETISYNWFGSDKLPLQRLHLNGNSLRELPNGIFDFVPNISLLNLHNNNISRLGSRLLEPCDSLRKVTLQNNAITELSTSIVDKLFSNAESFDISGNRLTFLPKTTATISHLKEVRLGGNPWQCKCLNEIFDILKKHNVDYGADQLFAGKSPICYETPQQKCIRNIGIVRHLGIIEKFEAAVH